MHVKGGATRHGSVSFPSVIGVPMAKVSCTQQPCMAGACVGVGGWKESGLGPTGSPPRQDSGNSITNSKDICPRVPEVNSKETLAQSRKQLPKARRERRCCVDKGNKQKHRKEDTFWGCEETKSFFDLNKAQPQTRGQPGGQCQSPTHIIRVNSMAICEAWEHMLRYCSRVLRRWPHHPLVCTCCSHHPEGVYSPLPECGWPCDLPPPITECSGGDTVPDRNADGP